ncbi:hypothetical protein ThvES_00020230, partial [Thiovulum sp. ES]
MLKELYKNVTDGSYELPASLLDLREQDFLADSTVNSLRAGVLVDTNSDGKIVLAKKG